MQTLKFHKNGFTLIEILIVIIIVGVLAGLAVPVYQAQVLQTYKIEAIRHLTATRHALLRFYAQNGTYSTVNFSVGGCNLDYCVQSLTNGGQTGHFTYVLGINIPMELWEVTAYGNDLPGGPTSSDTVSINQAGFLGGTMMAGWDNGV